ncbi:hypothetical protein DEJ47_24440 [Streptomyces venezuelae]|uniref:Uncharacterized protein n=1 Tax=Streptomyces venezuelae TaxID=54571 RepID=A0A5P2BF87_STRVZ|nr:hypothetical protein DEJ47_24440 [Streptomyces venezuelae]
MDGPPAVIDVEAISSHTDSVLTMRMDSSTRADIDGVTPAIVRQLNSLLGEDLGAEDDPQVRELVRKGNNLIDPKNRPTENTPAFGAFLYLRDAATLTRRLLWIYTERNGLGTP